MSDHNELNNHIVDLGILQIYNPTPYENITDELLLDITTHNVGIIREHVRKLETHKMEDVITVKLPEPETRLPREKPIPKPKVMTKWEKFAKEKGIKPHKKERMVFDEITQTWKPSWGYDRANNDKLKNWLIELPDNSDGYTDAYAQKNEAKKRKLSKIEKAQTENIKRSKIQQSAIKENRGNFLLENPKANAKLPIHVEKEKLGQALKEVHTSTASMGKFPVYRPPTEKPIKSLKTLSKSGQRNLDNQVKLGKPKTPLLDTKTESKTQLSILTTIAGKEPKITNVDRLANVALHQLAQADKAKRSQDQEIRSKNKIKKQSKAKKYGIGTANNKLEYGVRKKSNMKSYNKSERKNAIKKTNRKHASKMGKKKAH